MREEIEKKYLIMEDGTVFATEEFLELFPSSDYVKEVLEKGKSIKQGYLSERIGKSLSDELGLKAEFEIKEYRLRNKGGKFIFTIKGKGDLKRSELESMVDEDTFERFWVETKGRRVEKHRLAIPYMNYTLEIDVYDDRDLIVCEIEVPSVKEANNLIPLGEDITLNSKYKNKNLAI